MYICIWLQCILVNIFYKASLMWILDMPDAIFLGQSVLLSTTVF